ncbi:unnamed protein product [Rotaria socialis]|uniref:Uncharacterized protein n=2 Tax=Rotaria socialis TaxID=392032 RepID=A0A817W2F1_9BILA|nr:unnamed protein product [Rotaria socialis]
MKRLVKARNDNEHQDLVRREQGFNVIRDQTNSTIREVKRLNMTESKLYNEWCTKVGPSVIDNIPKSSKEISQSNDEEMDIGYK